MMVGNKFMKKSLLSALILVFFISCSHFPEITLDKYSADYTDIYRTTYNTSLERKVANEEDCIGLIEKIFKFDDSHYAKKVKENPFAQAEADAAVDNAFDKYPVNLSNTMRNFRDRFLGWFKNPTQREPITRSFEAAMRIKSELTKEAILKNGNKAEYDLVIVGTGVHGVIALQEALARNPKLRILLIDEGDTAGATFRYGKEVFSINSSNRASGVATRPLPGEGNINELPGMPIQTSDLTATKYPTANDLGTAIVAGLYSAVREHPNVDVLFGASAKELKDPSEELRDVSEAVKIGLHGGAEAEIGAQKIILTTGLGTPGVPPQVAKTLASNPDLSKFTEGKIPKVVNFEDLVRMLAMSNDPISLIKDKKVAIVGKGDSANVLIEFLLGYASKEGYAKSASQDGRVSKIFWIGQDKKDCKGFISDIRSRYQGISTGFRSSSKDLEAIITPYAGKISDVVKSDTGRVSSVLENGESVPEADIVILTTGFTQDVRGLFKNITNGQSSSFSNDTSFFENSFETLSGSTSTLMKQTKIGRKYKGREIYVLGTAAGDLTVKEELVGVIQNFVSIFNNAPRVVSATRKIVEGLTQKVQAYKASKIILGTTNNPSSYVIKNIQGTRTMGEQTLPYLESVFKEALSFAAVRKDATSPFANSVSSNSDMFFSISLNKNGNLEIFTAYSKQDLTPFIKLLASTREFFSLSKEALSLLKGKQLNFSATIGSAGTGNVANFDLKTAKLSIEPYVLDNSVRPVVEIENKAIQFRGLNSKVIAPKIGAGSAVERRSGDLKIVSVQNAFVDAGNVTSIVNASGVREAPRNSLFSGSGYFYETFVDNYSYTFLKLADEKKLTYISTRIIEDNREKRVILELNGIDRFLAGKNPGDIVAVLDRDGNVFKLVDRDDSYFQEIIDLEKSFRTAGSDKSKARVLKVKAQNYASVREGEDKDFLLNFFNPTEVYAGFEQGITGDGIEVFNKRAENGKTYIAVRFAGEFYPYKVIELPVNVANYSIDARSRSMVVTLSNNGKMGYSLLNNEQ